MPSIENLRGGRMGVVNNPVHLSAIRNMWNDRYAANFLTHSARYARLRNQHR